MNPVLVDERTQLIAEKAYLERMVADMTEKAQLTRASLVYRIKQVQERLDFLDIDNGQEITTIVDPDQNRPTQHAEEGCWNAYRYPTAKEIRNGRAEWDVYWVGASPNCDAAICLIPIADNGVRQGQVQFGTDGKMIDL